MATMPERVGGCTGITKCFGDLAGLFEDLGSQHIHVIAARWKVTSKSRIAKADRNQAVGLVMRIGKCSNMDQGVIEQGFGFFPLIRPERNLAKIDRRSRGQ